MWRLWLPKLPEVPLASQGIVFLRPVRRAPAPIKCVEPPPYVIGSFGRGEWIRTTDLLVPKVAAFAISLTTTQIFSCKVGIRLTQVALICWGLIFALFRVG